MPSITQTPPEATPEPDVPVTQHGFTKVETPLVLYFSAVDDGFKKKWDGKITPENFGTEGSQLVAAITWDHWRKYGNSIGIPMLKVRAENRCHKFGKAARKQLKELIEYLEKLADSDPKPDSEAMSDEIADWLQKTVMETTTDEIITDHERGKLTPEKLQEYTDRATATLRTAVVSPVLVDLATLYEQTFDTPKNLIKSILPAERLTLVAGKPKAHKTWIALQAALAVATGGDYLGRAVISTGRTLFIEFDDEPPQMQQRIHILLPEFTAEDQEALHKIPLMSRCLSPLLQGGIAQLSRLLKDAAEQGDPYQLFVIDPYLAVRSQRTKNADLVKDDYAEIAALRQVCTENKCAGLLIHHLRKAAGEDASDTVSGTTGITAAVDAWWIVTTDRQDRRYKLIDIKGRGIPERVLRIGFRLVGRNGKGPGVYLAVRTGDGPEEKKIQAILKNSPKTPKEIAAALGKNENATYQILHRMAKQGLLVKQAGRYAVVVKP